MEQLRIETGRIIFGAEEYWAFLGLCDGYHRNNVTVEGRLDSLFSPDTSLGINCANCYMLGRAFGNEIRENYEE
jgi:hypothetical protein